MKVKFRTLYPCTLDFAISLERLVTKTKKKQKKKKKKSKYMRPTFKGTKPLIQNHKLRLIGGNDENVDCISGYSFPESLACNPH